MSDPNPIEEIQVVNYDPQWKIEFEEIKNNISTKLQDLVLSIEHVGSTSIPDLPAKPIIDIDVIISSRIILPNVISKLAELGYVHEGNLGIAGREAFMWPTSKRHHLHVCSVETPNLHNHLIFRDYLRSHSQERIDYGLLKKGLAQRFKNNMDAYGEAKSQFIQEVLTKAEKEYGFHQFQPKSE